VTKTAMSKSYFFYMSEQEKNEKKRVMVAMSGGVDSSVAAYLLCRQGHHVVGVTMCLGIVDTSGEAQCCGPEAVRDARKVCEILDIPHYVMDFSSKLHADVITDFVNQYTEGRTPNPCVRCNRYLKFGSLLDYAQSCGFDYIATGHYAGIAIYKDKPVLKRRLGDPKDQTYFLYSIPSSRLNNILFPLSETDKPQVRELAKEAGLPVASKPESQEICFVPGNNYRAFLRRYDSFKAEPGEIVNSRGEVLGIHSGISNYTVGQRKGLGIASGKPLYVLSIDKEKNRVVLGDKEELGASALVAGEVNMLMDEIPDEVTAKIRYSQFDFPCKARFQDGKLTVEFLEAQNAVTPGQSVVLYYKELVVGGGIIEKAVR
jgi:tRNA-specific 2-thiouridylase